MLSSFFSLGLCFEGLFGERYILKGQIAFERALKTSILNIAPNRLIAEEILRYSGRRSIQRCKLFSYVGR